MEHLLDAGGIAAWSGDVVWGLLDAGLKGFVLLALVGASMTFMRRRSAAARHMAWMLAMAGLLVLPLVSAWTPKWYLALLPARTPALPASVSATTQAIPAVPSSPTPGEGMKESEPPPSPAVGSVDGANAGISGESIGPTSALNGSSSIIEPASEPVSAASARAAAALDSIPWAFLIVGVWLIGVVFSVTPLVFGMCAAHRLARRGRVIGDASWQQLAAELQTRLRIRCTVTLRRTDAATMPMAWGFRRPVVLLPEDADGWDEEKRRVVALHEFAHVKRRDCLTHAIARLAFALHWFNPLAWLAMRRLRIERERACDDLVLNAGSAPADYANHLLHIARSMRNPSLASAAAITMARAGQLEKRLRAILDKKRNRGSVTPWALVLGVLIALAVILFIAIPDITSNARGFSEDALFARARDIRQTTLEARFFGAWRNLPFDISKDEEADAKRCVELAKGVYKSRNGVNEFESQETREALEAILAERPGYFYAEYLLGTWHGLAGNDELSRQYRENAYRHAPVVIIQRYVGREGRPLVGIELQGFALECNRVKKGSLDPSLDLFYPALTTDTHGAIYLPVYDTVYRTDDMSNPHGYTVNYPKLGWFKSRGKVGLLPTATVMPEDGSSEAKPADAGQAVDDESHVIWQGYAATEDAGVLLTGISVRPNEGEWYSIGNRGWLLSLWADNNTEETQYLVAQIDTRTGGWFSGQTQRVVVFEFPAKFSGAVEQPFKVESSWRENVASLLVAKSTAVKPGQPVPRLEPGTYEELRKATFVIPFPDAATLPVKPVLKAHRYWRQDDQIWLEFEHADGEWQHPSDVEIPAVYARFIGEVRKTNFSSSPFGSGKTGFTLELGRDEKNGSIERRVIPGKYTISLVFRNVPAARKDDPEIRTTFPEITSNEIEIEIVDQIPENYYEPVYQEGWEEAVRQKLHAPSCAVTGEGRTVQVSLNVEGRLPCAIAFKATLESEDGSKQYEVGSIAAPAESNGHASTAAFDDMDTRALFGDRWRVIYTPSEDVASHSADIRQFYGREIVTDWMKLTPDEGWVREKLREFGADAISGQPLYETRDREWTLDLDGNVPTTSGNGNRGWPYEKGVDIAQCATQDGGGLRIQPNGPTRLLVLEGADLPFQVLKEVRERLNELLASTTTEVRARRNETVYVAVLTDERAVALIQIDADAQLRAKWLWCRDAVATEQLARQEGRERHTRHELI